MPGTGVSSGERVYPEGRGAGIRLFSLNSAPRPSVDDSGGASKQSRFAVGVDVLHLDFPFQDSPCPTSVGLSFLAGGTNRRGPNYFGAEDARAFRECLLILDL